MSWLWVLIFAVNFNIAEAKKLTLNDKFPSVSLERLVGTGRTTAIKLAAKNKITLIDFWASWCSPCEKSMPALGRLLDKFEARGFAIVGINVDEVKENGLQFAEKHGLKFTLLYDKNRKLLEAAGVMIMPTSFMVNRNGKIIWIQSGFRDGDESALGQDIEKFLSKK